MAPNPLRRAKSMAGLCDTQAAGTGGRSRGATAEAVNRARTPPEYLGKWNLHYNMGFDAAGKDVTLWMGCHGPHKPASPRFVVQHPPLGR